MNPHVYIKDVYLRRFSNEDKYSFTMLQFLCDMKYYLGYQDQSNLLLLQ